jgi:DNA repair exonuclease SbcCD ATPase subunit
MGVYFDYNFRNGKEVEKAEKCYLCDKEDVVYAEYYVLEGDVYKLYKDARKIIKGKEINVGSMVHTVCPECDQKHPNEEEILSLILERRVESKKSERKEELEMIQKQVESKQEALAAIQKEIDELNAQANAIKAEIDKKK